MKKFKKVLILLEIILAIGILMRAFMITLGFIWLGAVKTTKLDLILFGLFLPYLLIRFIFHWINLLRDKAVGGKEQIFEISKEWRLSFALVGSLTLGSALMKFVNTSLANIFVSSNLIDAKEGGLMIALEMGIIPIFAILAIGAIECWPLKQIIGVSWKIFIVGMILGAIFGSTYTMGSQSLICGILH